MPKYKLIVEYDGTDFVGWQSQDNGKSIQKSLEEAIVKLSNEKVTVFGAGRTDSGVHAKGQVAHFEISKDFTIYNITILNQFLYIPVQVLLPILFLRLLLMNTLVYHVPNDNYRLLQYHQHSNELEVHDYHIQK